MKKLIWILFTLVLAAVLISLSVANRQTVRFTLDPLSSEAPALAFDLPLYLLLFGALIAGTLLGGFATWLGQGKWRKSARRQSGETRRWRTKAEEAEKKLQASRPALTGSTGS